MIGTLPNPPNFQAPLSGHVPNKLQGNQANSYTLVNEASSQLSVNNRLYLVDPKASLLHDDNVQLKSVETLVDPYDDKLILLVKVIYVHPVLKPLRLVIVHCLVEIVLINLCVIK